MQIGLPQRLSTMGIVGLAVLSGAHWMRENIAGQSPVVGFALGVMPNLAAAFAMPLILASFLPRTSRVPVTVSTSRMYLWVLLFTTCGLSGWEVLQIQSDRLVFDAYDILATGIGSLLAYLAFGWHASGFKIDGQDAAHTGEA